MSFSLRDSLELSSAADFNVSINSAVPRWQRKALQSQTPGKSLQGTSSKTPTADRFIPNRTANSSFEVAAVKASVEEALASEADGSTFHSFLASNLLPGETSGVGESLSGSRVLAFKSKAPGPAEGHINTLSTLYTSNKGGGGKIKTYRHIPSAPERILDAPALVDDYYLKLLDWSSSNTLAVALGPTVYLWNAGSGSISELCTLPSPEDYVSSVAWIKEGGQHLAIGTASAEVQLWDCERSRQVRSMKGHAGRVGALDWNSHILSSGSRDAAIFNHDVRIRDHHVSSLLHHTQEVCGLKWSPDGTLLASGGNDNTLCIWDAASSGGGGGGSGGGGGGGNPQPTPKHILTSHQAAVKALAWCPWQKGVLATGGGTADRCIKVWNAAQGALLSSTDTGSQVCSLAFNPHERELLSSHGFSQNQLCLWKFPTMSKIKELTGHTARVLHTAVSPDGSTVCSAGADETLRFWRVFGEAASKGDPMGGAAGGGGGGGRGGAPGLIPGLSIR